MIFIAFDADAETREGANRSSHSELGLLLVHPHR